MMPPSRNGFAGRTPAVAIPRRRAPEQVLLAAYLPPRHDPSLPFPALAADLDGELPPSAQLLATPLEVARYQADTQLPVLGYLHLALSGRALIFAAGRSPERYALVVRLDAAGEPQVTTLRG